MSSKKSAEQDDAKKNPGQRGTEQDPGDKKGGQEQQQGKQVVCIRWQRGDKRDAAGEQKRGKCVAVVRRGDRGGPAGWK